MALYNHDPKKVLLAIGGRTIDSLQEGTGISLEPATDISTTQSGVDQDFTRNVNTNIAWTLTFTVQSGSSTNAYLTSIYKAQAALPFLWTDKNTNNTQASGICYIQALPSLMGERESTGREWVLGAVDVNVSYGGVA